MTKSPEPSADLHPLLEGLQQLKYGEDDNTGEGEKVLMKLATQTQLFDSFIANISKLFLFFLQNWPKPIKKMVF